MAHPTRTGDLVAFSFPPYQFDAETPGTLIARSQFFGQHGYVPDVQDLKSNTNMRATFLAGGPAIERGKVRRVRSIDLAPTAAFMLRIPTPQQSQGIVRRDLLDNGDDYKALSIIGLNDFHGQLDPTTRTYDNALTAAVGGASQLASMFDEEADRLPGRTLLLSGGDNVGASPPNSALLQDRPAIDVENAWGLDATAFGNHEFDFGIARILAHEARANFPFLSANIVDEDTGDYPDFIKPSTVFNVNGTRVGVIGATVHNTPELVAAGNTAGLSFLDEATRIKQESIRLRQRGVRVQIVVIHEGAASGANAIDGLPAAPWVGPINGIVDALQSTSGRSRDRRSHAQHRQLRPRSHPRDRGRQRRRQLLGRAADAQARRRRVDRCVDPHREGPRRRAAGRREGDRRRCQHGDGAAPERRDRVAQHRHQARSLAPDRVGDGQSRRRRDAREVPGGGGGDHQLGRPAGRHPADGAGSAAARSSR